MASRIFFADINAGAGYGFDRLGARPEPKLIQTKKTSANSAKPDKIEAPYKGA